MTDPTLAKLTAIIEQYMDDGWDSSKIDLDSKLSDDLHINSAHIIDIVLDIENEFGIDIKDEDIPNLITVRDVKSVIESS